MSSTAIPSFTSLDWGRTGYADAWQRQEELVARRNVGGVGDTLVFTEHDPVYTLGVTTMPSTSPCLANAATRLPRVTRCSLVKLSEAIWKTCSPRT